MQLSRAIIVALVVLVVALPGGTQPPPAPPQPATAASFDPAGATPYFASGPAAEARRRFAIEDWAGAARLFDAYLAASSQAEDREQAAFLAAYASSKAGRFADAAARFDALVASYPLLADHHRLLASRALFAAKQYDGALARARAVSVDSPLAADAALQAADALRLQGGDALDEAARLLDEYLTRYPDSWRAPEAHFRLAQVLEARSARDGARPPPTRAKPARKRDTSRAATAAVTGALLLARRHYVEVYVHYPTSSWAAEADRWLAAHGKGWPSLDGAQHLARGLALFDQMRNEAAEKELGAALASGGLGATQQCVAAWHRAQSVFKQRNRPRAAPLFDDAVALCAKAPKGDATATDLHARALYQGARCYAAKHARAEAILRFNRIEEEHPTHSFADDARVREAEILEEILDKIPPRSTPTARATVADAAPSLPPPMTPPPMTPPPAMTVAELAAGLDTPEKLDPVQLRAARDQLLRGVAEKYPNGDMGGESLFRLAFRDFEERRLDDARLLLEDDLKIFPREEGWWEAGRTLYWLGRVAAAQQRSGDATALYARCAREYPLSYYALMALNRLRESAPGDEKKLVAELARPPATPADLAWRFAPDPLYRNAAFLRGVELARLGLGNEARRELAAAGIRGEKKGARVDEPARAERLWVAAVLYDRAGEWALSHAIPRHVLVDYARHWPSGDNRRRWLISFPRGYESLVVEHAGKNGQPAALQFAIIREESAFDPLDESFANAVGLTQLTPAPARRFAQGLPYSREALHDPAINITIGARELGDLWRKTGGAAPLAIASYNAGEGAVRRWIKAAPAGTQLDEFIERIPYDETRGYTKRVLGSFFAYHWLYEHGDPVPALPPAPQAF